MEGKRGRAGRRRLSDDSLGRASRRGARDERDIATRFERLHAAAVALSAAVTVADVASAAAARGAALGGTGSCAISLLRDGELHVVACRGSAERAGGRLPSFGLDADLPLATALWERRALFVDRDADGNGGAPPEATGALAALPLLAAGHAIGAIGITFPPRHTFDVEERAFLQAFAHHCALALERARLFEGERASRIEAQRAEEEARRALEMRDRLVGVVGHDLRTPLAAIRMSIALLFKRGELSAEQARTLARIGSSAVRMTRIIRDLLDFSRLATEGSIPVHPRTADVAEVVRRAVAELKAVHPDREIEVEASGPAVAHADPDRIAQVVSNLVGNALQHSPADTRIRVTVDAGEPPAPLVRVRVHNEGPAIRGPLSELFEPFRRGPETPDAGSAGLGLYIVREVLRAHGGTVEVSSSDAEGTTFTVRLPRSPATTGRPTPDR